MPGGAMRLMKDSRKEFLDRSKPDGQTRALLDRAGELLDRLVNYGTHMLPLVDQPTATGVRYHLTISTLLLHGIEMVDGISILVRRGAIGPAIPVARSLMEGTLSLEYVLQADAERRAIAYQVQHMHAQIDFCRKLDPTTEAGKQFLAVLKKDRTLGGATFGAMDSTTPVEKVLAILGTEEFRPVEEEWKRVRGERGGKVWWYSLFNGPRNIEGLAAALNKHAWYEVLYRRYSEDVHATDALSSLHRKIAGGLAYRPLRYPTEAPQVVSIITAMATNMYRDVLRHYCSGKIRAFEEWYAREVRPIHVEILHTTIVDRDRAGRAPESLRLEG